MRVKHSIFLLLCLTCMPSLVFAQAPYSNQPAYDPNIPVQFGAGSQGGVVALPPELPEYLPNGAINLDEVWTQDGGARLYWNDVIIPRELKMAGNAWIDPALVPQLIPEKQTPVRRAWRRSRARASTVKKVKVPPNVASTSLKSPAIPLPLTPVETEQKDIPPLKAAQSTTVKAAEQKTVTSPAPARPRAETEMPDVTPPPLQ